MSELKGYRCPNCNAMLPISKGRIIKCDCCGSEYEKQDDYGITPLKVEVCEARLVNLQCKKMIPDEYLRGDMREKVIEHTLEGIAHELAKSIVPFMEVETHKDIETMTTIVSGRVRVADISERRIGW